jgi:hypothetical protein
MKGEEEKKGENILNIRYLKNKENVLLGRAYHKHTSCLTLAKQTLLTYTDLEKRMQQNTNLKTKSTATFCLVR